MNLSFYSVFMQDIANKVHQLIGVSDRLKIALSNREPMSFDKTLFNAGELSVGGGYPRGGFDVANVSKVRDDGAIIVSGQNIVAQALGGTIGPFQYLVLYNDTPFDPLRPLIGYWTLAQKIFLREGETFELTIENFLFSISSEGNA